MHHARLQYVSKGTISFYGESTATRTKYRLLFQKILTDCADGTLKNEDIP
jgi:hypothetical protein